MPPESVTRSGSTARTGFPIAIATAERTARELRATGETVRKRSVKSRGELTAQEAQVAKLARDGLSNPEIGERLFISARTAQYHLSKVFRSSASTHAANSTASWRSGSANDCVGERQ